jgi:hypothetical protein
MARNIRELMGKPADKSIRKTASPRAGPELNQQQRILKYPIRSMALYGFFERP